jgi:hypothetical protein
MIVEKSGEKQRPMLKRTILGHRPAKLADRSFQRIIEEVDADARHAKVTEGLNVRHAADESAFERREGFNFLGNFQAELKLDPFAEFEAGRKIGAALRDVHSLCRK